MDKKTEEAVKLLKLLIAQPSFSKEEHKTALLLENLFKNKNIPVTRKGNNVIAQSLSFGSKEKTLLLNSHHDTVKPNPGYTRDPFIPYKEKDKLYGLGSNDAGGALVSLIESFLHFYDQDLPFDLLFIASAEEEITGANGIASVLPDFNPDMAIVGEPTNMQAAVAEKGLIVLDVEVKGKSGHAARDEGENAIYNAIPIVEAFKRARFPNESQWLGPVKVTVTGIMAGVQHNVIPDSCKMLVDVRTTDAYTNEETVELLCKNINASIIPRSLRLQPSSLNEDHVLHRTAKLLGMKCFGSPTLSDQAVMNFPSIKIGPGDSARSHSADEYICISEIRDGINGYINYIEKLDFI